MCFKTIACFRLEHKHLLTWNTLMQSHAKSACSLGKLEHTKNTLEALTRASAAYCLWLDQAHARAQTRVSEPQTHMRARGIPSTQGAVTHPCWETSRESRDRHSGWETTGDK